MIDYDYSIRFISSTCPCACVYEITSSTSAVKRNFTLQGLGDALRSATLTFCPASDDFTYCALARVVFQARRRLMNTFFKPLSKSLAR